MDAGGARSFQLLKGTVTCRQPVSAPQQQPYQDFGRQSSMMAPADIGDPGFMPPLPPDVRHRPVQYSSAQLSWHTLRLQGIGDFEH